MEFLVVAALVLCVIALVISFTLRWQVLVREGMRNRGAVEQDAAMDGLQIFEAAVAASKEVRRARLARQERIRKILTPVAFVLCGSPVILALAAFYLAGDREAATVCIMMATVGLGSTSVAYFSATHERQKATHSALQAK